MPRTSRRQAFSAAEPERLLRVIRLRRLAREVFATDEAMAQWLSTADPALGGRTLLEILATDVGTAKAVHRVLAMFHGVPM